VEVSIVGGRWARSVHSDASGFFAIPIPWHMRAGEKLTLGFRHPDYQQLDLPGVSGNRLCIAHLVPLGTARAAPPGPVVSISNVVVQYSISTTTTVNIGSAVRTFQAVNRGNVPCRDRRACSPDGKWQAVQATVTLDAGPDHEFHNARASCIAGPCPFTRIQGDGVVLSRDGRKMTVSALDWSDTATFLLEAEVYKPLLSNMLRQSYPLIFEQALTFTLPPAAEGVSIEAEMDGTRIVYPLGPSLFLSWATCQLLINKDKTRVYRCELKPGYRFPAPGTNAYLAE
jgi:hypothetical protein